MRAPCATPDQYSGGFAQNDDEFYTKASSIHLGSSVVCWDIKIVHNIYSNANAIPRLQSLLLALVVSSGAEERWVRCARQARHHVTPDYQENRHAGGGGKHQQGDERPQDWSPASWWAQARGLCGGGGGG